MTDSPPIPIDTPFVAETDSIIVRVAPRFLPDESDPARHRYVWAYTVEIENRQAAPVTLRTRHWELIDAVAGRQSVEGPGVVGQEPEIAPGRAFRYTSAAPLAAPSGLMRGHYMFDTSTGSLRVTIPTFSLDSPHERARPS